MKKILVIDDSNESAQLITHLMRDKPGIEVVVYNDEFEALKNINSIAPDLILLDVYLAVTDGVKIKSFIEILSPVKIPVVFMSTYETATIFMGEEVDSHERNYLQKPLKKEDLWNLVHMILGTPVNQKIA